MKGREGKGETRDYPAHYSPRLPSSLRTSFQGVAFVLNPKWEMKFKHGYTCHITPGAAVTPQSLKVS